MKTITKTQLKNAETVALYTYHDGDIALDIAFESGKEITVWRSYGALDLNIIRRRVSKVVVMKEILAEEYGGKLWGDLSDDDKDDADVLMLERLEANDYDNDLYISSLFYVMNGKQCVAIITEEALDAALNAKRGTKWAADADGNLITL